MPAGADPVLWLLNLTKLGMLYLRERRKKHGPLEALETSHALTSQYVPPLDASQGCKAGHDENH